LHLNDESDAIDFASLNALGVEGIFFFGLAVCSNFVIAMSAGDSTTAENNAATALFGKLGSSL